MDDAQLTCSNRANRIIKLYVHSKPCTCISFHCTAIDQLNLFFFFIILSQIQIFFFFIPEHYVCLNIYTNLILLKKNSNWKIFFPRLFKCTVYECVFFTVCDQSFHLFWWRNADRSSNTDATVVMDMTFKKKILFTLCDRLDSMWVKKEKFPRISKMYSHQLQ